MKVCAVTFVLGAIACLVCGLTPNQMAGAELGVRPPLVPGIGANDQRVRVNPEEAPWRAVGKLQASSINFRVLCSATLVAPSTVVTAAHCLFNRRTQRNFAPESLHFLIGYNGSRYTGHAVGTAVVIGDGYDPNRPKETIGSDWALVSLDKALGSADRVLPVLSEQPENGANVMLGGYQQDHPLLLMADTQCRILGRFIVAGGHVLLKHSCAGTRGTSGAPLLIDTHRKWQVAAIEVAAEPGLSGGLAVVPQLQAIPQ